MSIRSPKSAADPGTPSAPLAGPAPAPAPAPPSAPAPQLDQVATLADSVLNALPEAVLLIDRDWRIVFANPAARTLSRIQAEDIGRNHWDLYPDTVGTEIEVTYRRAMLSREPVHYEFFYATFQTWYDLSITPGADGGLIFFYRDVTATRALTSERDRSQALLEQVLSASPDALVLIDRDWIFTFANRQAIDLLGAHDFIGTNIWEHFPGNREEPFQSCYRKAMEQRVDTQFEAFNGAPLNRWYRVCARPFADDQLIIFFSDITDRKDVELALRDSEERYRILADLNPQKIWMGSPEGAITYANQTLLDYLGPFHNPVIHPWLEAIVPGDRETAQTTWAHSVQTGEPYDLVTRIFSADEELRWFHLRAQAVRNPAGSITSWIGVAIDIHDLRTAADALTERQAEIEKERAELETVYRTAPIGLALFDPVEFRYLRLNDRQAAFFSLPREELLGKTVTEMAPIPGLREMFEGVARGTPIINFPLEGELLSRPGEHRFWTVNYFPVFSPDGSVQAISAASLEITQQKRAEAALMQSEKLAAVGRLASSISHEINNPLEAITNLLYLAAIPEISQDERHGFIRTAQSELARVSQIATQTLRFHRQAASPTRVSAAQLVNAVLNLYQGRLANSGIHVEATYSTSSTVLCFENDIRQVLNNLIGNAIDAMRSGGRLVARAHDAHDPITGRSGLRITIADTGHGMSEATRHRIFEPFFTTKDLNGTGLGLWISAEIIARHHGRLAVRSSQHPVHHGTIFTLFLPDQAPAPEPTPLPLP